MWLFFSFKIILVIRAYVFRKDTFKQRYPKSSQLGVLVLFLWVLSARHFNAFGKWKHSNLCDEKAWLKRPYFLFLLWSALCLCKSGSCLHTAKQPWWCPEVSSGLLPAGWNRLALCSPAAQRSAVPTGHELSPVHPGKNTEAPRQRNGQIDPCYCREMCKKETGDICFPLVFQPRLLFSFASPHLSSCPALGPSDLIYGVYCQIRRQL